MLKVNATNLPRFMACNGSRLMPPTLPPVADDPTARDEGTAAHYMAATAFNGERTVEEMIDRKAPNGVYMTADMAEHVNAYLSATFNFPPSSNDEFASMECDVTFGDHVNYMVPVRSDFIDRRGPHLTVTDFKYGWRIVEPERNWSLIAAAIGFCIWKQMQPQTVTLQIFQPRPHHPDGPLRKWEISGEQLLQLYAELTHALLNPSDELRTSNHCGECPALASCPAARLAEMNCIDAADMAFTDTIDNDLLSFNLDNLYRAERMIKDRLQAFEDLAKHRLRVGQIVNNYSVKMGLGNRAWKPGISADTMRALTGIDHAAKPKLITPAEAERRGVNEAVIAAMTERPPSGIKLTRGDTSKQAEKIFGATPPKG